MKKVLVTVILLSLLTHLSSCGDDEDPWEEWGINDSLVSCPIDGVYEGVIINHSVSDKDNAVWCTITNAPEGANMGHYPNVNSYIYFKRSDCAGVNLAEGQHISFLILKYGTPPPGLYFWDRSYFSCVINLKNDLI